MTETNFRDFTGKSLESVRQIQPCCKDVQNNGWAHRRIELSSAVGNTPQLEELKFPRGNIS